MNCPYCNVPLMGGMSTCPKCKYDTKAPGGGKNHIIWLFEHEKTPTAEQLSNYPDVVQSYSDKLKAQQDAIEENINRQKALAEMLISSGFNFDGYKIVKYSGYISGDDAIQIPRGGVFGTNNGQNLTDALVKIRRQALKELKEAAYALGCNAVVGVDFDYLTLEPETATITGGTLYEPYVICVTANGNAVVIEKE